MSTSFWVTYGFYQAIIFIIWPLSMNSTAHRTTQAVHQLPHFWSGRAPLQSYVDSARDSGMQRQHQIKWQDMASAVDALQEPYRLARGMCCILKPPAQKMLSTRPRSCKNLNRDEASSPRYAPSTRSGANSRILCLVDSLAFAISMGLPWLLGSPKTVVISNPCCDSSTAEFESIYVIGDNVHIRGCRLVRAVRDQSHKPVPVPSRA